MIRRAAAFASGLIFAAGLCLSGMTRPAKVTGFLDFTGAWDPSLAFVMVGAIAVAALAFRLAARRAVPLLGGRFELPDARRPVTARLVLGAAVFGLGWGLSGLCPGPSIVSLAAGQVGTVVFVAAMVTGMAIEGRLARRGHGQPSQAPVAEGVGGVAES